MWDPYIFCDPSGPHAESSDERGTIHLFGQLVMDRRGYVHRSNCGGTGYHKSYKYDERLFNDPLPFFLPFQFNSLGAPPMAPDWSGWNVVIEEESFEWAEWLEPEDTLRVGPGTTIYLRDGTYLSFACGFPVILEGSEDEPNRVFVEYRYRPGNAVPQVCFPTDTHLLSDDLGYWEIDLDYAGRIHVPSHASKLHVRADSCIDLSTSATSMVLTDCVFEGTLALEDQATLERCLVIGRIMAEDDLELINCVIVSDEERPDFSAVDMRQPSVVGIRNSFFQGPFHLGLQGDYLPEASFLEYCGYADLAYGLFHAPATPLTTTGLFESEPRFVDPANGDVHLLAGSPLIDAGDPAGPLDPDGTRADVGIYPYYQEYQLDVEEIVMPEGAWIAGPYPNPFNHTARLVMQLDRPARVTVQVYDVLGREARPAETMQVGSGRLEMPISMEGLATGLYFIRMSDGMRSEIRKAVLTR
ncbi:T9SS type A sorting domain-containing protein [bacterium]|nr:T9SS type A sorting domain-containing protein [bacterium]